jgi:menaquinol-cytochrome c reductase iron-sulfur subunit
VPSRLWELEIVFRRRQILKALIAGINGLIAATLAVPVLGYLLTPLLRKTGAAGWIALGPVADFRGPEPQRVEFRYTSQVGYTAESVHAFAYVIIPSAGEEPLVLSPVCTHMGCNVLWSADKQRFMCPCHGGQYLADGRNVAGPPPRPLERFPVRAENGVLMIQAGKET